MFGLTALETKLIVIAAILIIALLALGGFAWHERGVGAVKCLQADATATAVQEAHNVAVQAQGTTTVYQEASDYHEAVSAPIARPVRLRLCQPSVARPVSDSTPARSDRDGTATLRGADHSDSMPNEPGGPELQAVGRDANAQIAELQDYVRKVCSAR